MNDSPEEKNKLLFESVKWGTDFENPKQGSVIITKNEADAIDEYTQTFIKWCMSNESK